MAADVDIANLALQKLGAKRIATLTEDSRNARSCNNCYARLRDAELRMHPWSFAVKYKLLASSTTAPAFDYLYSFPLPIDCLKALPPNDNDLDWKIVARNIYTNALNGSAILPAGVSTSAPQLALIYVAQITDTSLFDPLFVETLAAKMAAEMCEEITQSNTKQQAMLENYKYWVGEAKKANAFENTQQEPPEDTWITAQL